MTIVVALPPRYRAGCPGSSPPWKWSYNFDGLARPDADEDGSQPRDQRFQICQPIRRGNKNNDRRIALSNVVLLGRIAVDGDKDVKTSGGQA